MNDRSRWAVALVVFAVIEPLTLWLFPATLPLQSAVTFDAVQATAPIAAAIGLFGGRFIAIGVVGLAARKIGRGETAVQASFAIMGALMAATRVYHVVV